MGEALFFIVLAIIIYSFVARHTDRQEERRQKEAGNQYKYPRFSNALRKVYKDKLQLHADNGRVLAYKIDVTFYERKVGETFFILGLLEEKNCLQQIYQGFDKTEIITDKIYLRSKADLSEEEYLEIIGGFSKQIATDRRFVRSTSGLRI